MAFYITQNGGIRAYRRGKPREKPFKTEKFGILNWFSDRWDAHALRDIIEDRFPRAFLRL